MRLRAPDEQKIAMDAKTMTWRRRLCHGSAGSRKSIGPNLFAIFAAFCSDLFMQLEQSTRRL
jgi:hypothetical protein